MIAQDVLLKFKADVAAFIGNVKGAAEAVRDFAKASKAGFSNLGNAVGGTASFANTLRVLSTILRNLGKILSIVGQKAKVFALAFAGDKIREFAAALGRVSKTIGDILPVLDPFIKKLQEIFAAFFTTGSGAQNLIGILGRLKMGFVDLVTTLSRAKSALNGIDGFLNQISQSVQQSGVIIQNFGFTLGIVGIQFRQLANLTVGPLRQIIQVGAAFEEAVARVKALQIEFNPDVADNAALAAENLAKLEKVIIRTAETTKFTATEIAEGAQFLALAGLDALEILDAIPGVTALAVAGNLDLARSADIATDATLAFGLGVEELTRVIDVLAVAQANSNTSVEQLSQAFKFAAPPAAALGLSIEETTAAIGQLSNAGIKASVAGTSLSNFLAAVAARSNKFQEVLQELSLTYDEVNPEKVGLIGSLRAFIGAGISVEQAFRALNRRGARFFLSIQEQGLSALEELQDKLDETPFSAFDIADTQIRNAAGAIKILKSQIQTLEIRIFEAFSDDLQRALKLIGSFIDQINEFFRNIRENEGELNEYDERIRSIAAAFGEIGILATGGSAGLLAFSGIISSSGVLISSFGESIAQALSLFTRFGTLFGVLARPIQAFRLALAGALAVLGSAAFAGVVLTFQEIATSARGAANIVRDFTRTVVRFARSFADSFNGATRASGEFFEGFREAIAGPQLRELQKAVEALVQRLGLLSGDSKFEAGLENIASIAAQISAEFVKLAATISTRAINAILEFIEGASEIENISQLIATLPPGFQAIIETIQFLIDWIDQLIFVLQLVERAIEAALVVALAAGTRQLILAATGAQTLAAALGSLGLLGILKALVTAIGTAVTAAAALEVAVVAIFIAIGTLLTFGLLRLINAFNDGSEAVEEFSEDLEDLGDQADKTKKSLSELAQEQRKLVRDAVAATGNKEGLGQFLGTLNLNNNPEARTLSFDDINPLVKSTVEQFQVLTDAGLSVAEATDVINEAMKIVANGGLRNLTKNLIAARKEFEDFYKGALNTNQIRELRNRFVLIQKQAKDLGIELGNSFQDLTVNGVGRVRMEMETLKKTIAALQEEKFSLSQLINADGANEATFTQFAQVRRALTNFQNQLKAFQSLETGLQGLEALETNLLLAIEEQEAILGAALSGNDKEGAKIARDQIANLQGLLDQFQNNNNIVATLNATLQLDTTTLDEVTQELDAWIDNQDSILILQLRVDTAEGEAEIERLQGVLDSLQRQDNVDPRQTANIERLIQAQREATELDTNQKEFRQEFVAAQTNVGLLRILAAREEKKLIDLQNQGVSATVFAEQEAAVKRAKAIANEAEKSLELLEKERAAKEKAILQKGINDRKAINEDEKKARAELNEEKVELERDFAREAAEFAEDELELIRINKEEFIRGKMEEIDALLEKGAILDDEADKLRENARLLGEAFEAQELRELADKRNKARKNDDKFTNRLLSKEDKILDTFKDQVRTIQDLINLTLALAAIRDFGAKRAQDATFKTLGLLRNLERVEERIAAKQKAGLNVPGNLERRRDRLQALVRLNAQGANIENAVRGAPAIFENLKGLALQIQDAFEIKKGPFAKDNLNRIEQQFDKIRMHALEIARTLTFGLDNAFDKVQKFLPIFRALKGLMNAKGGGQNMKLEIEFGGDKFQPVLDFLEAISGHTRMSRWELHDIRQILERLIARQDANLVAGLPGLGPGNPFGVPGAPAGGVVNNQSSRITINVEAASQEQIANEVARAVQNIFGNPGRGNANQPRRRGAI